MKNLVVLHLESISRQHLTAFESALPNIRRLLQESRVFPNYFSSATSTLMVVTYLFYGNDFEFDASSQFAGMLPAKNERNLFAILRDRGYQSNAICLNGFHNVKPTNLRSWSDGLPPVWGTNEFPALFARFNALTDQSPFAIYVWDLVTHIEHSLALAPFANGLTDQIQRACAVADDAVGRMLATLQRKGLLDQTTIVAYGDHGEDYWTHGFKAGMVHATEPYTDVTRTPLAIRDTDLPQGSDERLASTIDIAATCRSLLRIDETVSFPYAGNSLIDTERDFAFSQNFTANQPDDATRGIAKAFSVTDKTHTLLVSSQGLELYAYRLDPGNQCNLLHFFEMDTSGQLEFRPRSNVAGHFRAGLQENPRAVTSIAHDFTRLRDALIARVEAKRDYIVTRGAAPTYALERRCLDIINRDGRDAFFRRMDSVKPVTAAMPPFEFSHKLR
jgi:hypothetical protein